MRKTYPTIKKWTGNKIVYFKDYKKVMKSGTSGAISLPKKLVGKYVEIKYKAEQNDGSENSTP